MISAPTLKVGRLRSAVRKVRAQDPWQRDSWDPGQMDLEARCSSGFEQRRTCPAPVPNHALPCSCHGNGKREHALRRRRRRVPVARATWSRSSGRSEVPESHAATRAREPQSVSAPLGGDGRVTHLSEPFPAPSDRLYSVPVPPSRGTPNFWEPLGFL